ncbi:MAG: HU family DNA-binding protein [Bacteroidota bacterium]
MTKADLTDTIATGTGLTRTETEAVINGFLYTVAEALKAGERVDLRGFGVFEVRRRAARMARNPRTNQEVPLEAHYAPAFRPSRDLRDAVAKALGPPPDEEGA